MEQHTIDSNNKCLLALKDISKRYGNTIANDNISLQLFEGEVLGLVGANGAGKSTLMRVISGVSRPDNGTMIFSGNIVDWKTYRPAAAARFGIRVAYQELSLCTNLKVYENFFVEMGSYFSKETKWRTKALSMARRMLDEVFPGHGIRATQETSELSIAQQQMVEITRAFSSPDVKLVILDEPTSSLPAEQSRQLLDYVSRASMRGIAVIYITHRLQEIMEVTTRICVLRNGAVVGNLNTQSITQEDMILAMSGEEPDEAEYESIVAESKDKQNISLAHVQCNKVTVKGLTEVSCSMSGGEIVGIGGLEGNGQRALLQTIFTPSSKMKGSLERKGEIAYITGDRKEAGVFPLWSVAENMTITSLARGGLLRFRSPGSVGEEAAQWMERLSVKSEGPHAPITSLSGGNQQKVLIARALMSDAQIILLDDPTRGVDVETKRQLYQLFREAAREGKLVIWHSSDDSELMQCNRVLVMRHGSIVQTFQGDEINEQNILNASFSGDEKKTVSAKQRKGFAGISTLIPVLTMILTYVACGVLYPSTFSLFGVELLISGAFPLIMAALSQTFIIGYSHINLSLGNFMGLISVLAATLLYSQPALGFLLILLAWIGHGMMGVLIRRLNIPAVIVTLAFSFIWYGIAIVIRSSPGGTAPAWLVNMFNSSSFGVSHVLIILLAMCALAFFIERSKYGTVLRGFGNREDAMIRSGWNRNTAVFSTYAIAGFFAMIGGLSFTALTYSSDASAMDSYTLLTVASVILGGGMLSGGWVNVLGSVCGAITLSLVTILLGFLRVQADYTAAVQGSLLIGILALRLLRKKEKV